MSNPQLPPSPIRPNDAHKGTFGTVVVVGGCPTMIGAPALTATGALRSGAGLVKILTQPDLIAPILTIQPSATAIDGDITKPSKAIRTLTNYAPNTVLAVGPGLSQASHTTDLVNYILRVNKPVVLDADGLNTLAANPMDPTEINGPLILTPHPEEFKRLVKAVDIELENAAATDPKRRPKAAQALARHFNATVVLKGQNTIVADPDKIYTNHTGNPALATAGSGDVLTGVIAGFIAQGLEPFDATILAVHLHGAAADLWTQSHGPAGLTATDLANLLPTALNNHRTSNS